MLTTERIGATLVVTMRHAPVNAFGGGSAADSAAIQYVLRGPELEQLSEYSEQLTRAMRGMQGFVDVDSTLEAQALAEIAAIDGVLSVRYLPMRD